MNVECPNTVDASEEKNDKETKPTLSQNTSDGTNSDTFENSRRFKAHREHLLESFSLHDDALDCPLVELRFGAEVSGLLLPFKREGPATGWSMESGGKLSSSSWPKISWEYADI